MKSGKLIERLGFNNHKWNRHHQVIKTAIHLVLV